MKRDDDLRAGDLTARITLRAPTLNEDEDEVTGSTVVADGVPASKRALRGREFVQSGSDVAEAWTEFRIRYRTGLLETNSVEHDGRTYNVEAIDDPTGNRRVLVITARMVR